MWAAIRRGLLAIARAIEVRYGDTKHDARRAA